MKENSLDKTFLEMAETVFQERKEKIKTLKKHQEEEELKKRKEKAIQIAKTFLKIFEKSTNYTKNSQSFVTELTIRMFSESYIVYSIKISNGNSYNDIDCRKAFSFVSEYLDRMCNDEHITYENLKDIAECFSETKGFYAELNSDATFKDLVIGIKEE